MSAINGWNTIRTVHTWAYSIMTARIIWGHRDFNWNTRSRIDKYMSCVQNDCTPMPHLLAGGIGRNDVTCALVPVVRVYVTWCAEAILVGLKNI